MLDFISYLASKTNQEDSVTVTGKDNGIGVPRKNFSWSC